MTTRFLIACVALVGAAATTRAEINFGESIEWIVADSDRVIVGKITKIEKAGDHDVVTVAASTTIRGKQDETIRFAIRPGGAAVGWQKAGVPVLFCLKDTKEVPNVNLVLRHGPGYPSAFMLGKTDARANDVFTRDFRVLTDPKAVLKHVEAYAKTIPADWKRKSIRVNLPFDTPAHGKLWAGSAVYFNLPADATQEKQGKKWCASDRADDRVMGIISLKEFSSEENIKLLKGLLTDGNFSTGDGKKRYYVRARAFEVLRDFGVKVERPVLEEPAK